MFVFENSVNSCWVQQRNPCLNRAVVRSSTWEYPHVPLVLATSKTMYIENLGILNMGKCVCFNFKTSLVKGIF